MSALRVTKTLKVDLFSLIIIAVTIFSTLLKIPFIRQFFCFIFLTFIPGFLILHALSLNRLTLVEKFVLSVGLSISFLMLAGLLFSFLYPLLGFNAPLSTTPLLISLTICNLALIIIVHVKNPTTLCNVLFNFFELSVKEKVFLVPPCLFLLMSIFGMHTMNTMNNNVMLLAMLFLMPSYVILIVLMNEYVSRRIYPPMLFLMSLSLILMLGLRSNHIIGSDVHTEYYIFQQIFELKRYIMFMNSPLDACLSISILPTIYQSLLDVHPEYIFKILYPLLFSISPLICYIITEKYIGEFYGFLTAFFFMAQHTFLWTAYYTRSAIATLFFALTIMVFFSDSMGTFAKRFLSIFFAFSCILSHYSTSYVFFFALLFTWIGTFFIKNYLSHTKRALSAYARTIQLQQKATCFNFTFVLLFFIFLFFWYGQITGEAFTIGINYIFIVLRNLNDFFILETRGGGVASVFGAGSFHESAAHKIDVVLTYFIIIFITVGLLFTLIKRHHIVAYTQEKENTRARNSLFLIRRLPIEFFIFALVSYTILAISIILPHVSDVVGYGIDRLWLQAIVVLSPFFTIGGVVVDRLWKERKRPFAIILTVLILHFMCTSGVMYQIFGYPKEIALNSKGWQYDVLYVHEHEVYAAKWLSSVVSEGANIYTDALGIVRLLSQGMIRKPFYLGELIEKHKYVGRGYIYLSYYASIEGKLMDLQYRTYNVRDYYYEFGVKNKIYDNGGSEIWK